MLFAQHEKHAIIQEEEKGMVGDLVPTSRVP